MLKLKKVSSETWATSASRWFCRRKGTRHTPRGPRYPSTLQTSLQIVTRLITRPHINRSKGWEVNRDTPRLHAVGVYCERITCARMRFVFQRSGKLIPICRPGVKGCRKYECEHLLGASLRDLEASLFTPFAGGFQRMKRERRDTERRERERSGLAPPRD